MLVVESHVIDSHFVGVLDVGRLLARIGEYNAVRGDAQVEHFLYLVFARTIEARAQKGQELEEHRIRVTFYGVVGLNAWQTCDPVYMLVAYVFQVNNVEWIIFDILFIEKHTYKKNQL